MVFTSPTFLFGFLPVILALYYFSPWKIKNAILFAGSLFFYAWGEGFYVLVMIVSILSNHAFGVRIDRLSRGLHADNYKRKILLGFGVAVNLILLGWFKYANFLFENINVVLDWINVSPLIIKEIHLPLGISFFTFQAISYLVDVYRKETPAQSSRYQLGLYISLFPQPGDWRRKVAGRLCKHVVCHFTKWVSYQHLFSKTENKPLHAAGKEFNRV